MSAIETVIEEREAAAQTKARRPFVGQRRVALCHGKVYTFDGNRVAVYLQPDGSGGNTCWLETVNPDVWLAVGDDLRVNEHRRVSGRWAIRAIDEFETVFDALVPLDYAIRDCAQHGHAWSPVQYEGGLTGIWRWCVLCSTEQIWFPDAGEWRIWPAHADKVIARTVGALPTLHGPVVGGAR